MIYPIVIYGAQVLREQCKEVPADYPELKKLIEDMFATMYEAEGSFLSFFFACFDSRRNYAAAGRECLHPAENIPFICVDFRMAGLNPSRISGFPRDRSSGLPRHRFLPPFRPVR